MISPPSWMKRVGGARVGGQLAPFFQSVCVYFVALAVGAQSSPSARAAACKCAPVLCLLGALLCRAAALPPHRRRYVALVSVGLALSALGDALLVWPARLAAGMAAFGGAHVAYIAAFGLRPVRARAAAPLAAAAGAFLARVPPPPALAAAAPAYAALLAGMAWRGVARGGPAAAGALLFLLSDAVLAYSLFARPVPYHQVIVMSTYYSAQLGIAYSALRDPPADPALRDPPAAPALRDPPAALAPAPRA